MFSRSVVIAFLVLCSALAASVQAAGGPDDPQGKVLYMAQPSCDHYKCQVHWPTTTWQKVEWYNAPRGNVKVQLVSDSNGPTYTIKDSIAFNVGEKSCKSDAPKGESCGVFWWQVPANAQPGKYSVVATSLSDSRKVGYTDTVIVSKKKQATKRQDKQRLEQ